MDLQNIFLTNSHHIRRLVWCFHLTIHQIYLTGGVKTYVASYTIAQNALDNGGVRNSALVRASNVAGTIYVEDISDDGNDASRKINKKDFVIGIARKDYFH